MSEVKKYGSTDSEKHAEKMFQCRQIVNQILDFGVDQEQILKIIKILSLNLTDRKAFETMTGAVKALENDTSIPEKPTLIT